MANTLTAVVPTIFAKAQLALRNATVMPRLIHTDWANEVKKQGNTIDVTLPVSFTVSDVTPSSTPISPSSHTREVVQIALSYWRKATLHFTDKEAAEIAEGATSEDLNSAMIALAEDVNSTILSVCSKGVYGYAGVAATTPFANDLSELISAKRKLFDQKCPPGGQRSLVIDGAAEENILGLRSMQDYKGPETLRTGNVGEVLGFGVYPDQQVYSHTLVGDDCALDDSVARAVGLKVLHMDGLTTAPAEGDVFTIAGDSQTYVVVSSTALAGTDSDVTFEPGLKVAIPAADGNEAVTFKATHVANMAFDKRAFALASRPLAPAGGFTGGNIIQSMMDPVTGLGLNLEISRQHMQNVWVFSILFGTKCIRPEFACRIAG